MIAAARRHVGCDYAGRECAAYGGVDDHDACGGHITRVNDEQRAGDDYWHADCADGHCTNCVCVTCVRSVVAATTARVQSAAAATLGTTLHRTTAAAGTTTTTTPTGTVPTQATTTARSGHGHTRAAIAARLPNGEQLHIWELVACQELPPSWGQVDITEIGGAS